MHRGKITCFIFGLLFLGGCSTTPTQEVTYSSEEQTIMRAVEKMPEVELLQLSFRAQNRFAECSSAYEERKAKAGIAALSKEEQKKMMGCTVKIKTTLEPHKADPETYYVNYFKEWSDGCAILPSLKPLLRVKVNLKNDVQLPEWDEAERISEEKKAELLAQLEQKTCQDYAEHMLPEQVLKAWK